MQISYAFGERKSKQWIAGIDELNFIKKNVRLHERVICDCWTKTIYEETLSALFYLPERPSKSVGNASFQIWRRNADCERSVRTLETENKIYCNGLTTARWHERL